MAEIFRGLRNRVARLLEVPPEPEPPAGAPGSLRRFRAARNYLKYRLVVWGLAQMGALWGLLAGLVFVTQIDSFPWLFTTLEVLAWVGFVFQFVVSLTMVFLDWDLRWYLVTDRSLRIREGVAKVTEKTQSFANIQNLSIRRGPLQRLLGIADLEVRTAGGGGGEGQHGSESAGKESLHSAYFRGVDNAEEIRDVILARLRRFRDAGLGDPDELETGGDHGADTAAAGVEAELRAAVEELRAAARELRRA